MESIRAKFRTSEERKKERNATWRKVVEVAFWGTVMWGFARIVARFFAFTPYGVRSFARPLLGMWAEDTMVGVMVGTVILFFLVLGATAFYALVLARFRLWWAGLLYGFSLMLLFGLFFRIDRWQQGTLSTELAWFLSFGLFIGMTMLAERTQTG